MMKGRTLLFLLLGIGGFLAFYISYVKKERKESVQRYVVNPKIGDVYKMQFENDEGSAVTYYKINDIGKEAIYFYPGYNSSDRINDSFLRHFDTTQTVVFSRKDILEIRDGLWKSYRKNYTELLEIERK